MAFSYSLIFDNSVVPFMIKDFCFFLSDGSQGGVIITTSGC